MTSADCLDQINTNIISHVLLLLGESDVFHEVNLCESSFQTCRVPSSSFSPEGFDVRKDTQDCPLPLSVFQTHPGVKKRYFRHIKNLIVAFHEPGQGIIMPLLYPVTAQRRAATHTEPETHNNSLSPTLSGTSAHQHHHSPRAARGKQKQQCASSSGLVKNPRP